MCFFSFECFFLEGDFDDGLTFAQKRRERLPALYYEHRSVEKPLPTLEQAFLFEEQNGRDEENSPPSNFARENSAPEQFDEENNNNMEQEELIPNNQENPIVLLERIFVNNEEFEAAYNISPDEFDVIEPVVDSDDPLNFDEKSGIKFEVMHDYYEVDDILKDGNILDPVQLKQEGPTDDYIDPAESNKKVIPSRSGLWNIEAASSTEYDSEYPQIDSVRVAAATKNIIDSATSQPIPPTSGISKNSLLDGVRVASATKSIVGSGTGGQPVRSSSGVHVIDTAKNIFESGTGGQPFLSTSDGSKSPNIDSSRTAAATNNISESATSQPVPSTRGINKNSRSDEVHVIAAAKDNFKSGRDTQPTTRGVSEDRMNDVLQSDNVAATGHNTDGLAVDGGENSTSINVWKVASIHDQSDEDVLFIEPNHWPNAKKFELKGFVKRENDRFSENLPFSVKVLTDFLILYCIVSFKMSLQNQFSQSKNNLVFREYVVGFNRLVKVPLRNVNTCIKWSVSPFSNDVIYDRKIALAMLTLSHTKRELSLGKTNRDAVEFVKCTHTQTHSKYHF